jgi:hypothetical protein
VFTNMGVGGMFFGRGIVDLGIWEWPPYVFGSHVEGEGGI